MLALKVKAVNIDPSESVQYSRRQLVHILFILEQVLNHFCAAFYASNVSP
jgi:hypothetical protein